MKRLIALDTETTGFYWYKGHKPFLYIVAEKDKPTLVTKNVDDIKEYLDDEDCEIIMHNAKFDLTMLHTVNIDIDKLKGRVHDTTVLMHLLFENDNLKLENLAPKFLGKQKLTDSINSWFRSQGITKENRCYADVPDDIMYKYAAVDAELTLALFIKYMPMLEAQDASLNTKLNTQKSVYNTEMKLLFVLIDMYLNGAQIDVEYFKNLKKEYDEKVIDLENNIYKITGFKFNMKSTKQLADLLLADGANLPLTDKLNYQVNQAVLETLDTPIANAIVKYRKAAKFLKTYINAFLDKQVSSKLYADFKTNGAKTGRFSCAEPNLQNLPRPDESEPETLIIRRGFVSKPGFTSYYFDYRQQEYKIFMDYAKEDEIIDAMNNGSDYHTIIFERNKKFIPTRDKTKTFNFLLIYGGGINAMSNKIGIPPLEARELKENYFKELPRTKKLFKDIDSLVKHRGFLVNKFGRRRRLTAKEAFTGINFLCQGSAADYIKLKMVEIYDFLKPYKSHITLQVHDELVIDVAHGEEHLIPEIKIIMERSENWFKVKLDTDVKYAAPNWASKKLWEDK